MRQEISSFEDTVCGIPCIISVTYWEPYRPGRYCGSPEYCYPEEGGFGEWEILDLEGCLTPQLSEKLTAEEQDRLDAAVFDHMENSSRYFE